MSTDRSIEYLTEGELEELKWEIKAKEEGENFLEGVLFSIRLLYGKRESICAGQRQTSGRKHSLTV